MSAERWVVKVDSEPQGGTHGTREDAWLRFLIALDEHKCYAGGEAMGHMAWRFFGHGEGVFCNGVSIEAVR